MLANWIGVLRAIVAPSVIASALPIVNAQRNESSFSPSVVLANQARSMGSGRRRLPPWTPTKGETAVNVPRIRGATHVHARRCHRPRR